MKLLSKLRKKDPGSALQKDPHSKRPSSSNSLSEPESVQEFMPSDNSSPKLSIFDHNLNRSSENTSDTSGVNIKKMDDSDNNTLSRVNSVVVNGAFRPNSFLDVIHNQVNKKSIDNDAVEQEVIEQNRKMKDKPLVCDDFTIKDISAYLISKQMHTFSDDFAECTDFLESMKKQKNVTIGDVKKNMALNKIKHYMGEYYKLMDMHDDNCEYNPLKTIRERELKLQLHNLGVKGDEKMHSNTTKNFQKLMKNFQNVIQDPPMIPVLAFTHRFNVDSYKKKEGRHSFYGYDPNHRVNETPQNKYEYWKWFVGVNERYEDITIQRILHLKQEFMALKDNEERKLSHASGNTNQLSLPYNESRNLSSLGSDYSLSDDDSFKDYADVNEGLSLGTGRGSKMLDKSPVDFDFNKKGLNKVDRLIKSTIESLEAYEQSKVDKVLYCEAVARILINRLDRFRYENDEQLKKLDAFEMPSLDPLEQLKHDIFLPVPTCDRLTEISENNDLTNMVLEMTQIQSEISTTLQLRLKKIGVDDTDTKNNVGSRKRTNESESLITNIGFLLIEWIIKIVLTSIKLSYGVYSLVFPPRNEKIPESSPALST